ncbi:alpha/beta fold hydrolase [Herbiconiux sp. L3-i23]|uniref:alpha/beta fold hydrolase n=1 Tax=Herbiconiux sp. L3-i23 TaxID=2905871 RepID=UPI00204BDF3D|nr:alpha/beta hydrolase [Herbiconiux sp. L3-i23]BDI21986.1 3-oxoadipate enol-lactone hydrolase [Herbiconiux sp. L3-i23]
MQQAPRFVAERTLTDSAPRIAFFEFGDPAGPSVVLLHGVGSSASTWAELAPLLDPARHYLLPDYRGHGASDAPDGPYVVDDFVADLDRLLDERGIADADLVGFSIGAVIALAFALAEPERVRSLVLLSSIAGRTDAERERALSRLDLIRSTPPAELAPSSGERWFSEEFRAARPDLVEAELAIVGSVRHAPYAAAYEVLVETDQLDRAPEVAVPALIVTGENDAGSTPAMSEKLAARIADSRLHILPRLKHYMHIEDAPAVAALVNGFLDEIAAPPRP